MNEKYYVGFETEPGIAVFCSPFHGMKIWEGYFELFLSGCYTLLVKNDGILFSYQTRSGFYDEDNWVIPNLETAIEEIAAFRTHEVESGDFDISKILLELQMDFINFLQDSNALNKEVYIICD